MERGIENLRAVHERDFHELGKHNRGWGARAPGGKHMISDVLFDAVEKIKEYQRDLPEVYGQFSERIDAVTRQMEGLRRELDKSPSACKDVE